MARKLLLVLTGVFVENRYLQFFCGLWILLLALVLEVHLKPYAVAGVARLERMSIFMLCVTLSIFSLFLWDPPTWLEIILTIALFLSILGPVFIFLIHVCEAAFLKLINFSMDADGPVWLTPLKMWLRRTFLYYVEKELGRGQVHVLQL